MSRHLDGGTLHTAKVYSLSRRAAMIQGFVDEGEEGPALIIEWGIGDGDALVLTGGVEEAIAFKHKVEQAIEVGVATGRFEDR